MVDPALVQDALGRLSLRGLWGISGRIESRLREIDITTPFQLRDADPEEVVGLGQYGRTLTVLTCGALSLRAEAEEPDDDEDALIESWTPKFRR